MEYSANVPSSMTVRAHIEELRHLIAPIIANFTEKANTNPKDDDAKKQLKFLKRLQRRNQDFCDQMDDIFNIDPDDLDFYHSSSPGTGIRWGYSGWRAADLSEVNHELAALENGIEVSSKKDLLLPPEGEPPFQWGPHAENTEALAYAILKNYTLSAEYAALWQNEFAKDVTANIRSDRWFLEIDDLEAWIADHPEGRPESEDDFEETHITSETTNPC